MGISVFVDLVLIDDPIKGPNTNINLWELGHTNKISIYIKSKFSRKKKRQRRIREKIVTLMKTHDGMNPSASTQVTSP